MTDPRVAVVHDWLTGMRGGEQVLEAILELYPGAELFTLFHFPGSASPAIEARTIHTSSLQRLASNASDYRTLLPLFPRAIREFDLSDFDLVISSSHCVAKGVDARGTPHVCYCHTPMRYIWDRFDDYFPRSKPLRRLAVSVIARRLRKWDVKTAAGVARFVANSGFVRDRIAQYYSRDAVVIHPFVNDDFLAAPLVDDRGDYDVVLSALVPYKRVDLAVAAAEAGGRELVVIGGGPMLDERAHEDASGGDEDDRAEEEDQQRGARVEDVGIAGADPQQHAGEHHRRHDRADGDREPLLRLRARRADAVKPLHGEGEREDDRHDRQQVRVGGELLRPLRHRDDLEAEAEEPGRQHGEVRRRRIVDEVDRRQGPMFFLDHSTTCRNCS